MLFSSYTFIFLFLPVFLLAWQAACGAAPKTAHAGAVALLVFSLVFYGLWGLPFLALLLGIAAMNYAFGLVLAQPAEQSGDRRRKFILLAALVLNLLPLIWFKYSWFIIRNLALLLNAQWQFEPPALPPGISFYTFIQIAWLAGVYHRQFQPASFSGHMVFTSCFPYVISGPIVRYEQVGWQFDRLGRSRAPDLARGFTLFSLGLAKKAILADSIGPYADAVFNAAEKGWPLSCAEAWLGSLCYTFQLYFDFSGYTDMALGLGLMIGLRLPENFNSPYKSTGIVDFWHRWHITLSAWLRDFLYIPLGGNRHGRLKQYRNLFLTMLIGGVWHGAGWTYALWGAMHGAMLALNHFFRATIKNGPLRGLGQRWPLRAISIIFTFFCLNFCWVAFRAPSLDAAMAMYAAMSGHISGTMPQAAGAALLPNNYLPGWQPMALLCLCAFICWFLPNSNEMLNGRVRIKLLAWRPSRVWATSLAILVFASLAMLSRKSAFLYFQF